MHSANSHFIFTVHFNIIRKLGLFISSSLFSSCFSTKIEVLSAKKNLDGFILADLQFFVFPYIKYCLVFRENSDRCYTVTVKIEPFHLGVLSKNFNFNHFFVVLQKWNHFLFALCPSILYAFLVSPARVACPAQIFILDLIALTIFWLRLQIYRFSLYNLLCSSFTPLGSKHFYGSIFEHHKLMDRETDFTSIQNIG
jgi:hypothetical protein